MVNDNPLKQDLELAKLSPLLVPCSSLYIDPPHPITLRLTTWIINQLESDDEDMPASGSVPEVIGDPNADDEEELEWMEQGNNLAPLTESSSKWAACAIKYLKLICLHEHSVTSETNRKPENGSGATRSLESRILREANFALIDIQRAKVDEQRTKSFNDCLDELVNKDDGLDKSKLQKVLGQVRKEGELVEDLQCLDARWFSGTMHCETILVALLMLGKTDAIKKELTQEWLTRNGIFATKSNVLHLFEKMAPFIGISKRNCPVCFVVCKAAASMNILQASHELIIPGHHTTYSAVALPPFTPREVAETVLVSLKMAANDHLTRLQKNEKAEDSGESVGSHPNSNNSRGDDDLSSDSDIPPESKSPFYEHLLSSPPRSPTPALATEPPEVFTPYGHQPGQSPERRRDREVNEAEEEDLSRTAQKPKLSDNQDQDMGGN
ncbi:hypothetical protein CKM354_000869800 [Cercospora kikuchii]|uniref:Uncharacterized protein n=1 Tax=Cercospora kikuchii TaxID=84275 RepID=A0A9P3CMU2_9PEZI|nr:uncharacterized protein CKM354_000869800 [Cercospora kikuchii]GIZ45536.1 hypothetical protein CKM354_000869800 [Cercospora kikuchii]